MDSQILVADSDSRLRSQIKGALQEANHRVFEAKDGQEALEVFLKEKGLSLIILDVSTSNISGWQLCREIRKTSTVPIIMLATNKSEGEEVQGFEVGADDFLVKPFSLLVLVARVQGILRRTTKNEEENILEVEGIRLDKTTYEVEIEGVLIDLSNKEFKLLTYFLENQGVLLNREKILSNVWDFDYYGDIRTIDTHVKKIRSKMKGKRHYIKTIRGLGYKFTV